MDPLLKTHPRLTIRRRVAVFGSDDGAGEAAPSLYSRLGRALGSQRYTLLNGLTGPSRDRLSEAAQASDGVVISVTGGRTRPPNLRHCALEARFGDYLRRAAYMIETADAMVVLPGGMGTLADLTAAWNFLREWDLPEVAPPLVVWAPAWRQTLDHVAELPGLYQPDLGLLRWVQSIEEITAVLDEQIPMGRAQDRFETRETTFEARAREYLRAGPGDTRRRFDLLEPLIWRLRDQPIDEVAASKLVAEMAGVEVEEVTAGLSEAVLHLTKSTAAWIPEFRRAARKPARLEVTRRRVPLGAGDYVLHTRHERPEAAAEGPDAAGGGGGAASAEAWVLESPKHWVMVLQIGGPHAAVAGRTPRLSSNLFDVVDESLAEISG